MTTSERPTADRAVTGLSNEELLNALVYQATEHGSNVNDAFFKGSVHRSTLAAITAYRVELLRRLTATERPAETVTIRKEDTRLSSSVINSTRAVVLHRLAEIQTAINNLDSVQDVLESALSAASDGGDCE